jgi:hypothetical protein
MKYNKAGEGQMTDKNPAGKDLKAEEEKWWKALEAWEKRWIEERKERRLEEARSIREAEDEYQRFSHSTSVLTPPAKKVGQVLATQSREPALGKMRLADMKHFPGPPPFRIDRIIRSEEEELPHLTRIIPVLEPGKKSRACEYLACSLKRAFEFQTNEKINVILEESGPQEFLIKALEGAEFIPLCRICSPDQEQVRIEIQRHSFPYIHGYSFDVGEIVRHYLSWLQSFPLSPYGTGK